MAEIIPAILADSLEAIRDELLRIRGAARAVQLDVVDGRFAPNKTWPYGGVGQQQEFEAIVAQDEGLPLWEDFDFEIDLMAQHSRVTAEQWIAAGASRIVVHADAADAGAAMVALQEARAGQSVAVGLALPCDAAPEALAPFAGQYDFVQVMGIARVGFQGEAFDERALRLLAAIRAAHPDLELQVDGGVSEENIPQLAMAGASRLIVGSRIMHAEDPKEALKSLQSMVYSLQKNA